MEDLYYDNFLQNWTSEQANILADLEYNQNLAEHLITTELLYSNLKGLMELEAIPDENLHKWQILGFSMLSLQHRIYNLIPDFTSKQVLQLQALSKETIKEQRFHNDVVLSKKPSQSEENFLAELKNSSMLVKDAIITSDKTLKIVLNSYQTNTLGHIATRFGRDIDACGLALKRLMLYDKSDAYLTVDIIGTELFMKPL